MQVMNSLYIINYAELDLYQATLHNKFKLYIETFLVVSPNIFIDIGELMNILLVVYVCLGINEFIYFVFILLLLFLFLMYQM